MDTIHVLIADDSRDFRQSLRGLLEREEGLVVVGEAADGRQAVELAGEKRPEIVLMDIEMPVMDGIEATREIRSRWPEVRVVALTIYDRPTFREAMAEAGAVGYLATARQIRGPPPERRVKGGEIGELVAANSEGGWGRERGLQVIGSQKIRNKIASICSATTTTSSYRKVGDLPRQPTNRPQHLRAACLAPRRLQRRFCPDVEP